MHNAGALHTTPTGPSTTAKTDILSFYKAHIFTAKLAPRVSGGSSVVGWLWYPAVALAVAGAPRFAWCTGGGQFSPVAFDVHFEDRRVVDKPVHSGQRHCGIREDARPFAKWMISRNYQATPFVTGSDQLNKTEVSA